MDGAALEAAVRAAWVKAYGHASWEANRAFDDEGSNSLDILGVLLDLEDALGVAVPANIVSMQMTARDLVTVLARLPDAAPAGSAHDDRPLVFLFTGEMGSGAQASLREGLAGWFRFADIDASGGATRASEQMAAAHPDGAIHVIACGTAAEAAAGAAAMLIRQGHKRGFAFVLDPSGDAAAAQARIVDAFVASRHAAG